MLWEVKCTIAMDCGQGSRFSTYVDTRKGIAGSGFFSLFHPENRRCVEKGRRAQVIEPRGVGLIKASNNMILCKMWRDISVTDFVRNFADLINGVAYRGDHLRLKRGRRVLAEVHPAPAGRTLGELPEMLRNLPHLSSADAASFAADVDAARAELNKMSVEDRWES